MGKGRPNFGGLGPRGEAYGKKRVAGKKGLLDQVADLAPALPYYDVSGGPATVGDWLGARAPPTFRASHPLVPAQIFVKTLTGTTPRPAATVV